MALPTVEDRLGVRPPVFVRKLARQSHWGAPADDFSTRVAHAVREVFRPVPERAFSVYLLERNDDLYRVALGLNANRDSLTETIDLGGNHPDERGFILGLFAPVANGKEVQPQEQIDVLVSTAVLNAQQPVR